MNILVLHGEDNKTSYQKLSEIVNKSRSKGWDIVSVSVSGLTLSENVRTTSLFVTKRLFVLEGTNNLSKQDFDFLKEKSENFPDYLVIYFSEEVRESVLKEFPKGTKFEKHVFPKYIWNFLDSFYPKNAKTAVYMLERVLEKTVAEVVIALLSRHLISLLMVKENYGFSKMPVWKASKLRKQSSLFSSVQIKGLISDLANADYFSKTGGRELRESLDIIMLTRLA